MPRIRSIPEDLLVELVTRWETEADIIARRSSPEHARALRSTAADLRVLVDNRSLRWVDVPAAAELAGTSEETIRRKCRSNDGKIRFQEDNGRYQIWAPDAAALAEVKHAA